MTDIPIVYKKLEPFQMAFIKTCIDTREQILPLFDRLKAACDEAISGPAMVIFHGGADHVLVTLEEPLPGVTAAQTRSGG